MEALPQPPLRLLILFQILALSNLKIIRLVLLGPPCEYAIIQTFTTKISNLDHYDAQIREQKLVNRIIDLKFFLFKS